MYVYLLVYPIFYAEVCLRCGERLYSQEVVSRFEQIIQASIYQRPEIRMLL